MNKQFEQNPSQNRPGRPPGTPKIDPRTLPEHPCAKKSHMSTNSGPKSRESRPKVGPKASILGAKCALTVTKNVPGDKKVRPETAPEAFFVVFSRRCRSDSLSGPILEGSNPTKSIPQYYQEYDFDKINVFQKTPKK